MVEHRPINNTLNEYNSLIEMNNSFQEKLDIAELVLKTLGIKYQITTPKTHTTKLRNSLLRKNLSQIHDELIKS